MSTATTRRDVHKPSDMDPAHYTLVAEGDRGNSEEPGYHFTDRADLADAPQFDGHWANRGGCDHCGAHGIRWYSVYHHGPSNELVTVGATCAQKMGLDSRTALQVRKAREAHARTAKVEAFRTEHGDLLEYLEAAEQTGRDSFLMSLLGQLRRKGELSERQIECLRRSIERSAQWAAERAAAAADEPTPAPVIEGRVELTGKLLSIKDKSNDFGVRTVCTLLDDRGFKVWGTVPAVLLGSAAFNEDGMWTVYSEAAQVGDRVTFTATVTRSDRDETFGFFKRPSGGTILDAVTEEVTA